MPSMKGPPSLSPPASSLVASPIAFRRFNASGPGSGSSGGPQDSLSFCVSFILANLSAPALDSAHRLALAEAVSAALNASSVSAVELQGAALARRQRSPPESYSLQQAANVTAVLSRYRHLHAFGGAGGGGGPAALASSLFLALELAVYSGSATARFRAALASRSVQEATQPAIVAVMPADAGAGAASFLSPSLSPSQEPLVGSIVDPSRSNGGSSSLLTAGIVSGVLALLCLAGPLLYLLRRNVLKKRQEEKESGKMQPQDSKDEGSRSPKVEMSDGFRSIGSDVGNLYALTAVYSNEVLFQTISGDASFESFTGPSLSEIHVQGRGRRRKHKTASEDVAV